MRVLVLALFGAQLSVAGAILVGAQLIHDGSASNPIPGVFLPVGVGTGLVAALGARSAIETDRARMHDSSRELDAID